MSPPLTRIILYVKNIPKVAAFYQQYFDMAPLPTTADDWLELASPAGGPTIALHQAAKSQKSGAAIKLVFAVKDVKSFIATKQKAGLKFGPLHDTGTFQFANAKDPAGNSISISSRGL